MKVIPAKVTNKTKFTDTVKKVFFQLQQVLKTNVSKSNQLLSSVYTKAEKVSIPVVPKNKTVQKTKMVPKTKIVPKIKVVTNPKNVQKNVQRRSCGTHFDGRRSDGSWN